MKSKVILILIIIQIVIESVVYARSLHIQQNAAKNESDSTILIDLTEPWPHIMLDYYDTLTYVQPVGNWYKQIIDNANLILPLYMRGLDCYELSLKCNDEGVLCTVYRDSINDIYFCPSESRNSHFWGYSRLKDKYILFSGDIPSKLIKYNKKKRPLIIQSSKYGWGYDYDFPKYKISSNMICHILSRTRFTNIQQKALDMIAQKENIDKKELAISGIFPIADDETLYLESTSSIQVQIESSIHYNNIDSLLFYAVNRYSEQGSDSIKVSCSDINNGVFAIFLERKNDKLIFYFSIKPNLDISFIKKRNIQKSDCRI